MKLEQEQQTIRLLYRVAFVAGLAVTVMALLMILNYVQISRADPLNSPAIKVLTDQLKQDPANDQVRESIRELDLLARKAFFTSQWQLRTGGLILLLLLGILIVCLLIADGLVKQVPLVDTELKQRFFERQLLSRSWVLYAGIFLVVLSLATIFMTPRTLDRELLEQLTTAGTISDSTSDQLVQGSPFPAGTALVSADSLAEEGNSGDTSGTTVTALTGGIPSAAELQNNFPAFRGVGGLGIVYHKNIPVDWDGNSKKNIQWKSVVPLPGYNSPVIWGDRIFLTGASELRWEVYCFDAGTGKIRWTTAIKDVPGSSGQVPKVNRETGLAAPTVTTDGQRVYAIFANGDVAALNLEGKVVWSKNMGFPNNHYGHSSSLLMFRDMLIVQYDQTGNASISALRGATGEVVWKTVRNVRVSWASPILTGTGAGAQLVVAADPFVIAYDPMTGKEIWRNECISGEVGPSCAYANGIVFSVNDYSKVAAVSIQAPGSLLWEDTEYLSDIPSPVATKDYLFMVTSFGTLVCYDAATGRKQWIHEFEHPVYASPVVAEGKLYVLAKNGMMHIINAGRTFTPLATPQLGEGSVCTPAFADGRIYIRGDKHLFCIGK